MNVSGCVRLHGQRHRRIWQLPIETIKPCWRLTNPSAGSVDTATTERVARFTSHAGVVLADCNLTAEALEWVLPSLMKSRCLSIPFQNSKRANQTLAGAYSHPETHFTGAGNLWGQAITSDADRNTAVNALHSKAFSNCLFICPMSQFIAAKGWRAIFADSASAYDSRQFWADDGFMAGLVYSFLEGNNFRTAPVLRWPARQFHAPAAA